MNSPKLDLSTTRIFGECDEDIFEAMSLIGQEVYMSDDEDFESYQKLVLSGARKVKDSSLCYVGRTDDEIDFCYKHFILAEYAVFVKEVKKEKKLRPFKDLKEFRCATGRGIGDIVTFKRKDSATEYNLLFSGYSQRNDAFLLYIGQGSYSFEELMNDYLYYNGNYNEWRPFGVEE